MALAAATLGAQRGPVSFQLTWVDRQGVKTPIGPLPPGTFAPRLSPDGRRVAFDSNGAIWVAELTNLAAARRLAPGRFPMWSPDGSRVVFTGVDVFELYWQDADGTGAPERFAADPARAPESWSTALGLISYITLTGTSDYDIWAFAPGDRSLRPIIVEPTSAQMSSRFSPDGGWIAYQSNETGRYEIYVEPFPRTGTRTRVTDAGGERPVWSPDGREIFYDKEATLYVVAITPAPAVSARPPVALPISGFLQATGRRLWDVSADGTRFLMMFP
jgi:Tol biopolymer transport system component